MPSSARESLYKADRTFERGLTEKSSRSALRPNKERKVHSVLPTRRRPSLEGLVHLARAEDNLASPDLAGSRRMMYCA